MLDVEDKINEIQEEIEAVQGKLNYMKSKVAFSTIVVALYEDLEAVEVVDDEPKFFKEVKMALGSGLGIIKAIILGLFYIWPILIIAIGVFVWYKRRK